MSNEIRSFIVQFIEIFADMLIVLIFARVILSWIKPVNTYSSRFSAFIVSVTEPILSTIKKILPRTGMLDLSPVVAYLLIELLRSLITNLL
jgi:YggT family protein